MPDPTRIPMLVLGLGNVLCGDDGAGVMAIHRLRRGWDVPAGVRVVDGGTLGLDLLALVAASERVIIVDAVRADVAPGSLVEVAGDDVGRAVYERLSPHQIGVADLISGASLVERYPSEVVILGIVPAMTDLRLGCTPDVAANLDALVEWVVAELAARGYHAPRRAVAGGPADDGARALGL